MDSQASAASEMANLMDVAVSLSQQKEIEKKAKAKEAKIRRQVKKMRVGEVEGEASKAEESEGPKWFKPGELAIMIQHLDSNYNVLFGNCKKADYKQQRVKAWQQLIDELNVWNVQANNEVERDMESVKRKIDNLKQRGKNGAVT